MNVGQLLHEAYPHKVYIARPYTPRGGNLHDASRRSYQHVLDAIHKAVEIIKLGHYPIVPHLAHFLLIHMEESIDEEYWYQLGLSKLRDCDVLLANGQSKGVKIERYIAEEEGIPIVESIAELQAFLQGEEA